MGKPLYACATCGEDFTRRYSANRHNFNLHFGKGIIVRFLEYIIGRVSGQYLPPNALSYRTNRRGHQQKGFKSYSHNLVDKVERRFIPERKREVFTYRTEQARVNADNNGVYDSSTHGDNSRMMTQSHKESSQNLAGGLDHIQRTRIKFEELRSLLQPSLAQSTIHSILMYFHLRVIKEGNDEPLDEYLIEVRKAIGMKKFLDSL